MNLTDFLNQIRMVFLVQLKCDPWDSAAWIRSNQSALERCYWEGFQPAEAISAISGQEIAERDLSHVNPKLLQNLY